MIKGTTRVEFAGTREEAREFIHQYGRQFPHSPTLGRGRGEWSSNGLPIIHAKWNSGEDLNKVREAFVRLGWEEEFQSDAHHKIGRRSDGIRHSLRPLL